MDNINIKSGSVGKIILVGHAWVVVNEAGKVLNNYVLNTGLKLVDFCNSHSIKLLNKLTLSAKYRQNLRY